MADKQKAINGIPVETILALPSCKVRAAGNIWQAKNMEDYSATEKCIFFLDDKGQLTGKYSIVSKLAKDTPADNQKPNTDTDKPSIHNIIEQHVDPDTRKLKPDPFEYESSDTPKSNIDTDDAKPRNKIRFHVGAFILGMALVLFAMIGYFCFQLAIYEGLI